MTARAAKSTVRKVAKRGLTSPARPRVPEEEIRTRAYEIFLARRGGPGDAISDWFQAEHELDQAVGYA
jgi:hypothetical protein